MLKALNISNFALIDDLDMTFAPGLLAMTGETGAGKTIILESLQLLFGKRSDAQMIRYGEDRAHVSGTFVLTPEQQKDLSLFETITISRTIDTSGRHQIKIDDQPVTLQMVKKVTERIGSIHAQNDTMSLGDKTSYLDFIDQVDQTRIEKLKNAYLMKRSTYLEKKAKTEAMVNKRAESIEKREFMQFQLQELKSHHLEIDEKSSIDDTIGKLKNFDLIMEKLRLSYDLIDGERFSIDAIAEASDGMRRIASLDPQYDEINHRLSAVHLELEDIKSTIYQLLESLDFDPGAFERLQERSFELTRIETKYKKTINDLIDYQKTLEDELMMIEDYDGYVQMIRKEADQALMETLEKGHQLSKERRRLAKILESSILKELKDLDLEKAVFEILFEDNTNTRQTPENGLDEVEFMISLNEGEPMKPLSKVASGGERARFMFALKSIYAKNHDLSLLILDEIDIGISGKTAAKVASKMHALSKDMQLLVITHLPQVAARADTHYGITKAKENGRMVTRIETLSQEKRIEMIAMMLSDEELSHFAIEQAKTLLRK
ncbi:MAG: DNA repair protein RecN [Acholeplasmataceae bacterium]|nr:DNA repair protein RecN [Acholeplasmataceae bacterium]